MRPLSRRVNALKVLEALKHSKGMSIRQISVLIDMPIKTAQGQVNFLRDLDLVTVIRRERVRPGAPLTVGIFGVVASDDEIALKMEQSQKAADQARENRKKERCITTEVINRAREIQMATGPNPWACLIASMEVAA